MTLIPTPKTTYTFAKAGAQNTLNNNLNTDVANICTAVNSVQTAVESLIETLLTQEDVENIIDDKKGQVDGLAPLNSSSKIDATFLPSYVDDVIEFSDLNSFPGIGETGKIYITLDSNKSYRWSGSNYIEISQSITQIQSDWNQTDNLQLDFIKNKPALTGSDTSFTPNKKYTFFDDFDDTSLSTKWNVSASNASLSNNALLGQLKLSVNNVADVGWVDKLLNNTTGFIKINTANTKITLRVRVAGLANNTNATYKIGLDSGIGHRSGNGSGYGLFLYSSNGGNWFIALEAMNFDNSTYEDTMIPFNSSIKAFKIVLDNVANTLKVYDEDSNTLLVTIEYPLLPNVPLALFASVNKTISTALRECYIDYINLELEYQSNR